MTPRFATHALAVIVGSLVLFAALAALAVRGGTPWPDTRILSWVPPSNEPDRLAELCNAFVVSGMVLGTAFAALVFLWLIVRKHRREALFWFASLSGAMTLDVVLKPIFERTPIADASNGYSFPSGNALGSMALFLAAAALIAEGRSRRYLLVVGAAVVAAEGAALVYISWHYPSDVLAGWLLSVAWVTLLRAVIRPRPVLDLNRLQDLWQRRPLSPSGARRSRAGSD
jgi:membrane-associated phospholipid phosphatase